GAKVTVESWSFEVPINHQDAATVILAPRQYTGDVSQGHRAPCSAFVGVKSNNLTRRLSHVYPFPIRPGSGGIGGRALSRHGWSCSRAGKEKEEQSLHTSCPDSSWSLKSR